jgi:hypothetical protein
MVVLNMSKGKTKTKSTAKAKDGVTVPSVVTAGTGAGIGDGYFKFINESKLFIGLSMILLNIGSKYVDFKFTKTQEHMLRNGIAREILIFTIVFMGTRDITYAILLTAAFIILSEFIFNDQSKYCLASMKMKKIAALIDTNNDGIISPEEEQKALDVLQKAEKMRSQNMQGKYNAYLHNMNGTDPTV